MWDGSYGLQSLLALGLSGLSGFPIFGKTNTAKFQFDPECTDTFCSVIFKTSSVSPTRVLNPRSPARKSDAQLIN